MPDTLAEPPKATDDAAAAVFQALAHGDRLRVIRTLVKAGPKGAGAGAIARGLGATPSRTSFHLAALAEAGLVTSRREARHVIYAVNFAGLGALVSYLMQDCCAGDPALRACCPPSKSTG